jgi:hypothetical protein
MEKCQGGRHGIIRWVSWQVAWWGPPSWQCPAITVLGAREEPVGSWSNPSLVQRVDLGKAGHLVRCAGTPELTSGEPLPPSS